MDVLFETLPRELQNLVHDYDPTYRDLYRIVVASMAAVLRLPPRCLGRHSQPRIGVFDDYLHPPITRKDGASGPSFIVQRVDHAQDRNEWCWLATVDGSPGTWLRPFEALLLYRVDLDADLDSDAVDAFADNAQRLVVRALVHHRTPPGPRPGPP